MAPLSKNFGRVAFMLFMFFLVAFSGTLLFANPPGDKSEAAATGKKNIDVSVRETNSTMGERAMSLFGMAFLIGVAYILSTNRKAVNWSLVAWGVGLQVLFALVILRTAWGKAAFEYFKQFFDVILSFTAKGGTFIFGTLAVRDPGVQGFDVPLFAFAILPTIIFFSSLMAVLYHLGMVQFIVKGMAWVMMKTMGTSGAESLSSAANVFVGQTEAPLVVKPYVEDMTLSELHTLMVGGLATVAGGVMAAYVQMGVNAGHLLSASVMSAPAALVMSKILLPEEETPKTSGDCSMDIPKVDVNVIDAAARGAGEGLQLALNVGAMLLAFIALIAMLNHMVHMVYVHIFPYSWFPKNLEVFFGWCFSPLAFIMGTPWKDCKYVGTLMGLKTVVNEFVGYQRLASFKADATINLSARAEVISTYALCGFSNFSSIAIQLGGLGAMAPSRKHDLAKLGIRALIGGSLACFMTATIAGLIM